MSAQPNLEERHGIVTRRLGREGGTYRQVSQEELRRFLSDPNYVEYEVRLGGTFVCSPDYDLGYEVQWDDGTVRCYWDMGSLRAGTEVWESICQNCGSVYEHRYSLEVLRGNSGEGIDWCNCCMPE